MGKMVPFCCLETEPLFNMEACFNEPGCFADTAAPTGHGDTLWKGRRAEICVSCGQDGSSWVMPRASKGPVGFEHSQLVFEGEDFCSHASPGAMKCDFGRHFLLPCSCPHSSLLAGQ